MPARQSAKKPRHKVPARVARSDVGKAVLREAESFADVHIVFEAGNKANTFWICHNGQRKPLFSCVGNISDWRAVENLRHDARAIMRGLGAVEYAPKRLPSPAKEKQAKEAGRAVPIMICAQRVIARMRVDKKQPYWVVADANGVVLDAFASYAAAVAMPYDREVFIVLVQPGLESELVQTHCPQL